MSDNVQRKVAVINASSGLSDVTARFLAAQDASVVLRRR
jgi:NADP-dependent 3-hydroxy acid dehydrogenase YdfG